MSEHKQAFHAFLIAYPNMQFIGKWKDGIKYHFWECLFRDRQSENNGFILELVAAEAITAFTYWFQNPYDVDMRVLNSLITKILELLK